MKEKKKLKSLSLNKEEIVNLNEYEMNNVQGGTWTLTRFTPEILKASAMTASIVVMTQEFGNEPVVAGGSYAADPNCMGGASLCYNYDASPEGNCMLPEIDVTP